MMANNKNNKLEARNVNLSVTDWAEIETYTRRSGIRDVSAVLRFMLQERRNLLKIQKLHDAMSKEADGLSRLRNQQS